MTQLSRSNAAPYFHRMTQLSRSSAAPYFRRMTQLAKEAGPSLPDHVRLMLDTIISDLSQAAGACDRILGELT